MPAPCAAPKRARAISEWAAARASPAQSLYRTAVEPRLQTLAAVDVGRFSGSVGRNFGVIDDGECGFVMLDPTPGAESIQNSSSVVTPGGDFGGDVSFHAEAEAGQPAPQGMQQQRRPRRPRRPGRHELQLHRLRLTSSEARRPSAVPRPSRTRRVYRRRDAGPALRAGP